MASQQSRYSRDDGPLNEAKSQFEAPAWLEARGIRVKRSGSSVLIHCPDPNHEDSHPSCSLKRYPAGWGWKCFSCSSSGNSIQLVQMLTGVSAADAIAEVHKFSGVPMAEWNGGRNQGGKGKRDRSWASSRITRSRIADNNRSGHRNRNGAGRERSAPHQSVGSAHAPRSNSERDRELEGGRYGSAPEAPSPTTGWIDEGDLCELYLPYDTDDDPRYYEDAPYDTYEDWGEPHQLLEPTLEPEQALRPVYESSLTGHPQEDSFERLLITEETARRFENISDDHATKLQKICHFSRLPGDNNNLLNLWLEQRGWSPEVASKVDIHVAARVFKDTRLHVVRHPFYGVGHRLLGWADRVQTKDRRENQISQRWLANSGPTPPLVGTHALSGQPIAMFAEGVSDWVTITDNAPHGAAPLCVPGTSHKELAAREMVGLLRHHLIIVFGDRDAPGVGLSAMLSAAAQVAALRVVWASPDDGDLSDLLATSARTHNPHVARMHLKASIQEMANQIEHMDSGARWRLKLP